MHRELPLLDPIWNRASSSRYNDVAYDLVRYPAANRSYENHHTAQCRVYHQSQLKLENEL